MKIGFVSSAMYSDVVKRLVQTEFPYIDVIYQTYEDYTTLPAMIDEWQLQCDTVLFSGCLSYYHCCANCLQKVPWMLVQAQSSTMANALRTALEEGYSIQSLCISDGDMRVNDIEIACQEVGVNIKDILYRKISPAPTDYSGTGYNEYIYQYFKQQMEEGNVTCCITSNLYTYRRLVEEHVPVIFRTTSYDTFRQSFQTIYRQLTEPMNQQAQVVVIVLESDLPFNHLTGDVNDYQYLNRRLKVQEKVYHLANQLQGLTSDAGVNQFLIVTTRNEFELGTNGFREFALFRELNRDVMSNYLFGIGYGINVSSAKKNAYTALSRARSYRSNTACLVSAEGAVVSLVLYLNQEEQTSQRPTDKLEQLARKSGIGKQQMVRLYEIVERNKTTQFTSGELAEEMGLSKRSMDRMILKLEAMSLARVVGKISDTSSGRPKRVIELNLFT